MPKCEKCGQNTSKGYACEHTKFEEYCKECYTELHYYITEKKDNEGITSVSSMDSRFTF